MRWRPRSQVEALPVVLLAAALWVCAAPSRPITAPAPEVEPNLPIALDLNMLPADPGRGEPPRLIATIGASDDLRDVSLSLVLPEAVNGDSGALPEPTLLESPA